MTFCKENGNGCFLNTRDHMKDGRSLEEKLRLSNSIRNVSSS